MATHTDTKPSRATPAGTSGPIDRSFAQKKPWQSRHLSARRTQHLQPDQESESLSRQISQRSTASNRRQPRWWKIRLFRGMLEDVRRRAPHYWSDWKDAWDYRVVPATVYMYFAKYDPIANSCSCWFPSSNCQLSFHSFPNQGHLSLTNWNHERLLPSTCPILPFGNARHILSMLSWWRHGHLQTLQYPSGSCFLLGYVFTNRHELWC
jgi:HCO3- transporter family